MLEMGFLVFSYLKTVGVKLPGLKKIFCILSDNSVHANEGYRHSLCQQLDLNNITDDKTTKLYSLITLLKRSEDGGRC